VVPIDILGVNGKAQIQTRKEMDGEAASAPTVVQTELNEVQLDGLVR
jgi:hypothetical protein